MIQVDISLVYSVVIEMMNNIDLLKFDSFLNECRLHEVKQTYIELELDFQLKQAIEFDYKLMCL